MDRYFLRGMARLTCLLVAGAALLPGTAARAPVSHRMPARAVAEHATPMHRAGHGPGDACLAPDPAVRTARLDHWPRAMALDAPAHRLLVADAAGATDPTYGGQGLVEVLDTTTLKVLARQQLSYDGPYVVPGTRSIAVDARTNRAFVLTTRAPLDAQGPVTTTSVVDVLDATSGALRRAVPLDGVATAVAVDERADRAFVLTADAAYSSDVAPARSRGRVVALDARNGAVLATATVGQTPIGLAVDGRAGRVLALTKGPLGKPIVTYAGTHWPVAGRGQLAVLDAARLTTVATATVGLAPLALGVDALSGRAFVVNGGPDFDVPGGAIPNKSSVSVLDTRTGATVRTVRIDGLDYLPNSPIVVAERANHVFFHDAPANHLSLLDATSGALARTLPFPRTAHGPIALGVPAASDERRERLVFGGGPAVSVVDARSGRVLTVPPHRTGFGPLGVAVDEQAGRVFTLNAYTGCPRFDPPSGVSVFAEPPQ